MISVVMPFRDGGRYVEEAARSVLEQTVETLELVAVDDGSTDDGPEILGKIGDPRLRVVENPGPRGPLAAEAYGLELARYEVVALMDADDVSAPDRLERQLPVLEEPGVALVGSLYGRMTPNGFLLDPPPVDWEIERRTAADFTRGEKLWCDPSAMFRRGDAREIGFVAPDLGPMVPPTHLWYQLLERGACVVVGRPLYYHRLRLGSLSHGGYGVESAAMWEGVRAEYDPETFEGIRGDRRPDTGATLRRKHVTRAVEVYLAAGDLEAARRTAAVFLLGAPFEPRAWKLAVKAALGRAALRSGPTGVEAGEAAAGGSRAWRPAGRWAGGESSSVATPPLE